MGCDGFDPVFDDAFLYCRPHPAPGFAAGLRKMPFSLEESTPSRRLLLPERGRVAELFGDWYHLGRDAGPMVEGRFGSSGLPSAAAGVCNGAGTRLARDDDDVWLFAERLTVSPAMWMTVGLGATQRNDSLTGRLVCVVGMAAGVGFYTIALVGTLMVGLTILLLSKTRFAAPRRDDFLLQFNCRPSADRVPPYQVVLDTHCRKVTPINVRTLGDTDLIEVSCYIRLRNKERGEQLIGELNKTPGIQFVNLFFDEEQI